VRRNRMANKTWVRGAACTLAALAIAGCAGSEDPDVASAPTASEQTTTTAEAATTVPEPVPGTETPTAAETSSRPTTPEPASGTVYGTVGETVRVSAVDLTVDDVWFDTCADDPAHEVAPGMTGLFVSMTLTNVTSSDVPGYGNFEFTLLDAPPAEDPDQFTPMFGHCHMTDTPLLEQGVTGKVVMGFEIPPDRTGLVLRYGYDGMQWAEVALGE